MQIIEISSLPKILFSHIYKSDTYSNSLAALNNFLEISYIEEGTINCDIGGERFCAKKGDVVCFFRNSQTTISANTFHCHHTVAAKVDWSFSENAQSGLLLPTITPAESNTASIRSIIDSLIHKQILYKTSRTNFAAKFLDLLCTIDSCNRKSQNQYLPGELFYTQHAKNYIQKNIYTSITQNSIAEHLGISPEYLCSVFKKTEGTTIMRYINKIKLENIKALMDNTNTRLYKAAAMYGYSDPNYVSRLYKQLFGYNITDKPTIHPEIKPKAE